MQVGLGPGHIVLDGDPAPPPQRGTPQFSAHISCGQMAAWIKMSLGMEVGLGPGDFVLDWDSAPPPQKGGRAPIFGPCLLWPNDWMDEAGTWHGGRPQPRRLCVRWGSSLPFPKRGQSPSHQFLAHYHCGQTAGCIKMLRGTDVGLSSGDFVLDGDPAPSPMPFEF